MKQQITIHVSPHQCLIDPNCQYLSGVKELRDLRFASVGHSERLTTNHISLCWMPQEKVSDFYCFLMWVCGENKPGTAWSTHATPNLMPWSLALITCLDLLSEREVETKGGNENKWPWSRWSMHVLLSTTPATKISSDGVLRFETPSARKPQL